MSVKRKATSAHEEPAEATKAYAGASTIDAEEIANFERMAEEWWDPSGKFKPLHQLNPARITYIREQICAHFERDDEGAKPLAGLKLIDIGCGGGLVAEPMHRLGADVTGLDASPINVGIARTHAEQGGLTINYIASSAEEHSAQHAGAYDVVLALEIVEHVADVPLFVDECVRLVKPGGVLVMSTINRTNFRHQ